MPKYAYFDHTEPAPQRVRGWYDTDWRPYANLPNAADLLQLTDQQWDDRLKDPSAWAVRDGALIAKPPPKGPVGPTKIAIPAKPVG